MNASELLNGLAHFHGSEERTRHGLARNVLMTEGVVWMRKHANAYWLVDAVVSYLVTERVRREPFQVWTLRTALINNTAVLTMTDGNSKKPVVSQAIEFTDFPLAELSLYLVQEGEHWVLMLPSEY